ncbi:AraC-like DNA-binding protein [Pedobacter africanus]|uniref:AraC-like DNA-binding protein n=2 Tax=Pedobacter africanus TaxID=151894 RepID=A0ACC6L0X2_9SPHI|nr:AraC-like DNA-binding protein [Pedobacter africanus]
MKLKDGFKALFGTTIFGLVRELRMVNARRLLLDEKLQVNEVAEKVGCQHPHHFAVAFRRRFGILPGTLKS